MGWVVRLVPIVALISSVASPAIAQQGPAGDRDDQIVITGCVVRADQKLSGPRTFLVWSKGDVYLDSTITDIKPAERAPGAVGTSGNTNRIFYWIDDEDDLMKHAGKRVEVVGELSDELDEGKINVERKGALIEVEFEWEGKDVTARVPTQWLTPETPARDVEFDVAVRRVDVEKVNVLGSCN
jgi:hypothetical protein